MGQIRLLRSLQIRDYWQGMPSGKQKQPNQSRDIAKISYVPQKMRAHHRSLAGPRALWDRFARCARCKLGIIGKVSRLASGSSPISHMACIKISYEPQKMRAHLGRQAIEVRDSTRRRAIISDCWRSSFLCQVQEVRYVYVGMQSCQRGY